MEKTCKNCRRSAMCNHSGSVCRNWREPKAETPKITPEEFAAQCVIARIEWRTKRDGVENADGSKTVLEHHHPVVIVDNASGGIVYSYYAYLSRNEISPPVKMSDEWKGTTKVVGEYMPHDGGFSLIRAMEEG